MFYIFGAFGGTTSLYQKTLRVNFISRENIQDTLLGCHHTVMLIMDSAKHYLYFECSLKRTGTNGCKMLFSEKVKMGHG